MGDHVLIVVSRLRNIWYEIKVEMSPGIQHWHYHLDILNQEGLCAKIRV